MLFQKLKTYREMGRVIEAFAADDSRLGFVIVRGNPGIGKTNTFRHVCGDDAVVIECNTTAFGLCLLLWQYRDAKVLILDDVDTIMSSPVGLNLLKTLCQTDRVKRISWNTNAAKKAGVPTSFTITARVLLFCNTLKGKNFAAVLDRGHCYHFAPTPEEVHQQVMGWMAKGDLRDRIDPDVVKVHRREPRPHHPPDVPRLRQGEPGEGGGTRLADAP